MADEWRRRIVSDFDMSTGFSAHLQHARHKRDISCKKRVSPAVG